MAIHSSEKYRQHLPVQGPRLTGRMLNFVQLVGLRQSWLAGQKPRKQRKGPQQRQRREEIFGSLCLCLGAIEAGTTVGVMVTGISQEEMKENEDHVSSTTRHRQQRGKTLPMGIFGVLSRKNTLLAAL